MWLGNAGALAERLKEFYILKELPKVNLFGFNDMFFSIVGSIMLVAPISLSDCALLLGEAYCEETERGLARLSSLICCLLDLLLNN